MLALHWLPKPVPVCLAFVPTKCMQAAYFNLSAAYNCIGAPLLSHLSLITRRKTRIICPWSPELSHTRLRSLPCMSWDPPLLTQCASLPHMFPLGNS